MIKAILFDLDGTLVNSLYDLAFAVNEGLKKYGFECREVEKFKYYVGDGIPKMIERALPENEKTTENIERVKEVFFSIYKNHFADKTVAYDGMPQVIKELKKKGYKLAVVTNKAQEMADLVVKKFYSEDFDVIFGKRENLPAKPDPAAAKETMKLLNVLPKECIFIGDSGVDVLTGVNSGALPVGELWGFRKEDELIENGARYIVSTPYEFAALVEEINGK